MLKNTIKTSKLINIIVAMSENQVKQVKGLDMLLIDKQMLEREIQAQKHHFVVAVNIVLYFVRHQIILIDPSQNQGKQLNWMHDRI